MTTINELRTQFVVVDNFYTNPDAVRMLALQQEFFPSEKDYKGVRTGFQYLPTGIKEYFENLLHVKITNWRYQHNGIFQVCTASQPIVYHSDKQQYAASVYLTPNAPVSAGTNFYRSRTTGIFAAPTAQDAVQRGNTVQQIEEQTYRDKLYDKFAWELVDQVGNRYNRLVVWNAHLLHSAGGYFGHDMHTGRLNQLFFFDAIPTWQLDPEREYNNFTPPLPPSSGECTCPPTTQSCSCSRLLPGLK